MLVRARNSVAWLIVIGLSAGICSGTETAAEGNPIRHSRFGDLPIHFESNQGQFPSEVRFLMRSAGFSFQLTLQEAITVVQGESQQGEELRMSLVGSNPAPRIEGRERMAGKSNYFKGRDPSQWIRSVPHYGRVRYSQVYPGIDLEFHGARDGLEYDFVVSPGAEPERIRLRFQGAESLRIDDGGNLIAEMKEGIVVHPAPFIYQDRRDGRATVAGRFRLHLPFEVSFEVEEYDTSLPLVIDPLVLVFSTFLGGAEADRVNAVEVDDDGNVYIAGTTSSDDFPTRNPLQPQIAGPQSDAFIAKLSADGSQLIFSTFLGGASGDTCDALALDPMGNIYIAGSPTTDFPVTDGAFDTRRSGSADGYVAKLSPDGSELIYASFLGSRRNDGISDIAVDASGSLYATGFTDIDDFPVTSGAFQETFGGGVDAFVTKFSPDGSSLVYSTHLGGSGGGAAGTDRGFDIAVDDQGSAYVSGRTGSSDFPVTQGAFQTSLEGAGDAFVAKLSPDGSSLEYSTFLGGGASEDANGIDIDGAGNAYVTGSTGSNDFPVRNPIQFARAGMTEVFVAKLNADGSDLIYSTFLGGSSTDFATAIAVDGEGNALIAGRTSSSAFPVLDSISAGPTQGSDAFVTKINAAGTQLVYSTFLGGSAIDEPTGTGSSIAVDAEGSAYVVGETQSADFPLEVPFQTEMGGREGFVAKISEVFNQYFAQFGNGQGLMSDIEITNPSIGNRVSGEVVLTNDDGLPFAPNLEVTGGIDVRVEGSRVFFSLPALGAMTISSDGQGEVIAGAASIRTNGGFGGLVRFSLAGIGSTGVAGSQAVSGFVTPVRRTASGINTGIAVHNLGDDPVDIELTLLDQQGEEIAASTIQGLPGRGHLAQFINELFPGAVPAEVRGSLRARVIAGQVAATALELGDQPGEFTTLPVTALN